jgi:hypothetical protein
MHLWAKLDIPEYGSFFHYREEELEAWYDDILYSSRRTRSWINALMYKFLTV